MELLMTTEWDWVEVKCAESNLKVAQSDDGLDILISIIDIDSFEALRPYERIH